MKPDFRKTLHWIKGLQFWIQSLEDHDYHAVMPGPRGIGHCVDLHVILLDIGYCKFPQAQDLVSRVYWLLTSQAPKFFQPEVDANLGKHEP